jgi:cell division protein FtsB
MYPIIHGDNSNKVGGYMADEKKRSIIPVIVISISALIGLILGYYIWGAGRHAQVDYKQVLQETANYISSLEQKNESLTSEVGKLESELNTLKQQSSEAHSTSNTITSLSGRVQTLEAENQRFKDTIQRIEAFAQGDSALGERIRSIIQQGSMGTTTGSPSKSAVP